MAYSRSDRSLLAASLALAGAALIGCAADHTKRDAPALGVAPGARYAVMAVVPHHGKVYWGLGQGATEVEARTQALQLCDSSSCKVVQNYGPGDCAAVVLGYDQVFWTENKQETAQTAMDYCVQHNSDCRIVRQLCL